MTTAILAALRFGGNFKSARQALQDKGYISHKLRKSRFNRRLHRIKDLFLNLFRLFGETWKELNAQSIYVIDSVTVVQSEAELRKTA